MGTCPLPSPFLPHHRNDCRTPCGKSNRGGAESAGGQGCGHRGEKESDIGVLFSVLILLRILDTVVVFQIHIDSDFRIREDGKLIITPHTERAELEKAKAEIMENERKAMQKRGKERRRELLERRVAESQKEGSESLN